MRKLFNSTKIATLFLDGELLHEALADDAGEVMAFSDATGSPERERSLPATGEAAALPSMADELTPNLRRALPIGVDADGPGVRCFPVRSSAGGLMGIGAILEERA